MMKELLKAVKGAETPAKALEAAIAARRAVEKAEDLAKIEAFLKQMEGGRQARRPAVEAMKEQGLLPSGKQGLIAVHQTYPGKLNTAIERTTEQTGKAGIDMPSFQVTRAGSDVPLDPQFGPVMLVPKAEVIDPASGRTATFDADAWVPRDKGNVVAMPKGAMGKGLERMRERFGLTKEETSVPYGGENWGMDQNVGVTLERLTGGAGEISPNSLGSLIAKIGMKDKSKAPSWALNDEAYNVANNYDLTRAEKEWAWSFREWMGRNREKGLSKMMSPETYKEYSATRQAAKEMSEEWDRLKKQDEKVDRLRGRRGLEQRGLETKAREAKRLFQEWKEELKSATTTVEQLDTSIPWLRDAVRRIETSKNPPSPMVQKKLAKDKEVLAQALKDRESWVKEKIRLEQAVKKGEAHYKKLSKEAQKFNDEVYRPLANKHYDLEQQLEDLANKGSDARIKKGRLENQAIREWFEQGTTGARPIVNKGTGAYELNPKGFQEKYPDLGRGREMEMGQGPVDQGFARGVFSRRFEDLDEMRAAARRGQMEGERWNDEAPYWSAIEQQKKEYRKYLEEAKKAYDELMHEAGQKYDDPTEAPFFWHPETGGPMVEDMFLNRIIRALRGGKSVAEQFGLPYSSPRFDAAVNNLIASYQRLGSDYFEAKNMERLPFEDIRAAVFPAESNPEAYPGLLEKLKEAGVEIFQPGPLSQNRDEIKSFLRKFMFSVPPAAVLGGAAVGE